MSALPCAGRVAARPLEDGFVTTRDAVDLMH